MLKQIDFLIKQIIVRTVKTGLYENYCRVVYTKSENERSAEVEFLLPHGNAKSFAQTYVRTSPHELTDVDCLVSQNINNNEIYSTLFANQSLNQKQKATIEK